MSDGSRTIKRIHGEVILGVVIGNVARDHSMIARLRVRLKVGFDPHNRGHPFAQLNLKTRDHRNNKCADGTS